jgi:hypothetical protein
VSRGIPTWDQALENVLASAGGTSMGPAAKDATKADA